MPRPTPQSPPFTFRFFERPSVSRSSQHAMSDEDDHPPSVAPSTGMIIINKTLPYGSHKIIELWRAKVKEHNVSNRRQQFLLLTQMTFASQTSSEQEKSRFISLLSLCLLSELSFFPFLKLCFQILPSLLATCCPIYQHSPIFFLIPFFINSLSLSCVCVFVYISVCIFISFVGPSQSTESLTDNNDLLIGEAIALLDDSEDESVKIACVRALIAHCMPAPSLQYFLSLFFFFLFSFFFLSSFFVAFLFCFFFCCFFFSLLLFQRHVIKLAFFSLRSMTYYLGCLLVSCLPLGWSSVTASSPPSLVAAEMPSQRQPGRWTPPSV